MTVYIAVGFAAAAVLWLIIWSIKGLLLTPAGVYSAQSCVAARKRNAESGDRYQSDQHRRRNAQHSAAL